MAKTVFILGAGASKDCGAPLMKEFLDRARDLLAGTQLNDDDKKEFEKVFAALVELRGVFYKSGLDLDNIESVFSAFEMARLIRKLGGYDCEKIETLDHAIKKVITRTLEKTILFNVTNSKIAHPHHLYRRFVENVWGMDVKQARAWSVMTFNYDIALDYAFYSKEVKTNYNIGENSDSERSPYLKLHGSLGWGYCQECKAVGMVETGPLIVPDPYYSGNYFSFSIIDRLHNLDHAKRSCNGKFEPMIVPPTWNKGQHHELIGRVWQKAANELGEAENIIVIGYSLPETDLFFRYLYALGAVGDAHIRRFWVFNPDTTGQVENRFKKLVGKGVEDRFQYFDMTFSECLDFFNTKEGKYW